MQCTNTINHISRTTCVHVWCDSRTLFSKHRLLSRLHCTILCSARTHITNSFLNIAYSLICIVKIYAVHEHDQLNIKTSTCVYTCDVTHELYFLKITYSLVCIAQIYAVHEHDQLNITNSIVWMFQTLSFIYCANSRILYVTNSIIPRNK